MSGSDGNVFDDVIASIARAHVVMARHRQKVGGLSRDELERLKGRPLSATEEAFLRERLRHEFDEYFARVPRWFGVPRFVGAPGR